MPGCWRPLAKRSRCGNGSGWRESCTTRSLSRCTRSRRGCRLHASGLARIRPGALETEGLVAALNRQIDAVRAKQGISAQTITSTEPELPIEVKQALYRVGREALWNAVKHARARRVDVRLEAYGDSVELEIA